MKAPAYDTDLEIEYTRYMQSQNKTENTIYEYLLRLNTMGKDPSKYFANPDLLGRHMRIAAYRNYLKFLQKKMKIEGFSREQLEDFYDEFPFPIKRGNGITDKDHIPKADWADLIAKGGPEVIKMTIWFGLYFGLRTDALCHIRIQDIDLTKRRVYIRFHKKTATQKAWKPKANRERQIPMGKAQAKVLTEWITKRRGDLPHNYLFYTPNIPSRRLSKKTLQTYMKDLGITTRKLRYSFAVWIYKTSNHNILHVSKLLGHSDIKITQNYLAITEEDLLQECAQYYD